MANNKTDLVPWGLHPLMPWVEPELKRRANEYGRQPNQQNYSGLRTSWARFFSNGIAPKNNPNETLRDDGFVMGGVHGFSDSYGFNTTNEAIIGYGAGGVPHKINAKSGNTFPYRPPPTIESVEVSLYGGQNATFSGLCRRARINWKCYSLDQLNYLAPYFLMPKITATVEWGWNTFDQSSLLDLTNMEGLRDTLIDGGIIMKKIQDSNGNYDAMIGFIFDYGYTLESNGSYNCFTEFVNSNWLLEGKEYKRSNSSSEQNDSKSEQNKKQLKTMI
jgi:hypothetical protein